MQTAARIAKVFGIDPVRVLDDSRERLRLHVRIAALRVVQDDERKANEQQRKAGASRSRRRR